ncbi:MAG TPA: proline racemase family protein [Candidatus Saccharimonadales bacterium]|nr:proline racemase family protein [Candidatus Saccharimonadales bacterium]
MAYARMVSAIDVHAEGEPGRVIVGGVFAVPGATMFEKKLHLQEHADDLRKLMLREPRGYPGLCCNLVLPPTHPDADIGFVIMEQTEYPAMSGSNTICVVTALLETGMLPAHEPITELTLDTPAGLVKVTAEVSGGKVRSVTFANVASFALHLDRPVEVPTLGTVTVDVAWGGMFYVIADAAGFGLRLTPDEGRDIARIGEMIRAATREQLPVTHPEDPRLVGPTISMLSGPALGAGAMRNAVTVSVGEVSWDDPATWTGALDRSPCGTGTSAKMATLYARGALGLGDDFAHEGILGTIFHGHVAGTTTVGGYPAILPTIRGQGWITGFASYVLDTTDPFPSGYTVGDIWGAS